MNCNDKSLQALDLTDLCMHIEEAYQKDKTALSGAVFALLARKLLTAEVRPGGPYKDAHGVVSLRVNIAIGQLFNLMGTPLPLVQDFIQSADVESLSPEDRNALSIYHASILQEAQSTKEIILPVPYQLAYKTFERMSEPLRSQSLSFLQRVAKADTTGEIAGIAAYVAQSFEVNIPRQTLHKLGEANIYGWIAYMIYDHIVDGQTDPSLLSVANVSMRLSLTRYLEAAPKNKTIHDLIARYFDDIDEANAWELSTCRFTIQRGRIAIGTLPDYGQYDVLARRSGIHILGPIILAHSPRWNSTTQKMQGLTDGLRHYLIARQLSDDVHDWKDDIKNGQISAVVTQLLACNHAAGKIYNLKELTSMLQQNFLQHSMKDVCGTIIRHTSLATSLLAQAGCKNGPLVQLIDRLAQMTQASLRERARFLEFSRAYKKESV